jgi:hypothetical protein
MRLPNENKTAKWLTRISTATEINFRTQQKKRLQQRDFYVILKPIKYLRD